MTLSSGLGGLSEGGSTLWHALVARDESLADESNPLRELAVTACRMKDRCDRLDACWRSAPAVVIGERGPVLHPALVEARHHGEALRKLLAALRLPDAATGRRPQRRGPRGVYRARS